MEKYEGWKFGGKTTSSEWKHVLSRFHMYRISSMTAVGASTRISFRFGRESLADCFAKRENRFRLLKGPW